jgi:tRNA threonylcarbamoyladenosine biosynthesis protein TsaE
MEYMNTNQKSLQLTTSLKTNSQLAAKLASLVQPPQLIELVGDLGGGKTAFTKELGRALGVSKTITSPTFNIHRSYDFEKGKLEHFDLYRLADDDIVLNELQDCLEQPSSIVVVEWAQHFTKSLAPDYLSIEFVFLDENTRQVTLMATGPKSQNIIEKLR